MYRKKDDDSLVILKEINMHDLTAQERQLATNEVQHICFYGTTKMLYNDICNTQTVHKHSTCIKGIDGVGSVTFQATIMSKLNHPNIINCYDSFEEDGTIWIEMEYADGG